MRELPPKTDAKHRAAVWTVAVALAMTGAAPLAAIDEPDRTSAVAERAFRHPDLWIRPVFRAPDELTPAAATRALEELAAIGITRPESARLDVRSGRWGTLLPTETLLPGVAAQDGSRRGATVLTPADRAALELEAWQALLGYLSARRAALRVDPAELPTRGRVTAHGSGELVQIHAPRVFRGVRVRDSYLTAVINHGNLVLFGAKNWGDVDVSPTPRISADEARIRVQAHVGAETITGSWGKTELILVPLASGSEASGIVAGRGYDYRLVWVVRPTFAADYASWEALIDAHSGDLVSFEDTNHYATAREVRGGVFPVSNDGTPPDGVEQSGWPMPFESITNGGDTIVTDSGGNAPLCLDGNITSSLSGPFVNMFDNCGAISLTSAGDLDFGTSGGTDCTTPGSGGAGNTHSSRTGFHELNRLREQAEGQLPANSWLQQQLTANMNIDNNCNAFWNGSTVNFYTSGGGCANTGELAGVFDHEWGHGMDDNDVAPFVSSPGEGIADLYMYLRLDTSCIGRGFRLGNNCTGFGDPCLDCDGVREIDWAKRLSNTPHDVDWADSACSTFPPTGHPCGGITHCEGQVYAEAVYDLVNRDLPSEYGMDHNTALEVVTRLTYLGAGPVGSWFQCVTPFGGCNADGGYLNYLAADDDNGNINDGTPHMQAIFDAFNRHQIACNTPTVTDSGCAGTPATAPAVTATAQDRAAALSWSAVTGATKYQVFRTDGVFACDFGKVKVGETTGISFIDSGLQNGRDYSYVVVPIGAGNTCMGPASACDTVAPTAGANLAVDVSSASLVINTGDGDDFLDNCESATWSFDVHNIGTGNQTNVRIDDVRPISHPGITIDSINAVSPSGLADCAIGSGSFDFTAADLSFGDTVVFEVDVTSDELSPQVKTATVMVQYAESDLQFAASKVWDFESDLDDWTLIQGTFDQTTAGGGASGSAGYLASSTFLPDQCDQVRSPALQLTTTSDMTMFVNFDIETFDGQWWDRANFAVLDGGVRTAVDPDSGRTYNATGVGGSCVTTGQNGWAGGTIPTNTWVSTGWSAGALGSASLAGKTIHLDAAYGTDALVNPKGFWFDKVTLTDVDLLVPDAQVDVCNTPPTVTITAPAEGAVFDDADTIDFTGTATDIEDLVLTPSLAWTSDLDGMFGAGGTPSAMLSVGYHTVIASVTDSGGLSDSDQVHVVVENPPDCVANLVVDNQTVSGVANFAGVNSVTLGVNTILDATSDVTVEAGKQVILDEVEIRGSLAVTFTPTPCP